MTFQGDRDTIIRKDIGINDAENVTIHGGWCRDKECEALPIDDSIINRMQLKNISIVNNKNFKMVRDLNKLKNWKFVSNGNIGNYRSIVTDTDF